MTNNIAVSSSNRRIAKNTVLLYLRTLIVLFISLYTSRLVLKALGAEDMGIYNVVGGIVALMLFFRASLSKATSRFITYGLGNGSDESTLMRIFSAAMTNHLIIVGVVIIVGETVGLLILNHWTDIPEIRQTAAFWTYQCALVIFCIQIITSPYESVVIAQEDMSIYAYMSILSAVLKLVIALIMLGSSLDRLILYGVLMVLMDASVLLIYYIYDHKKYSVFRFSLIWDADFSKRMFTFSGWTLLGSSTNALTQQGVSLLFNNFIGLIANTALGFANQINAALSQFVSSFSTAFNPQIIKLYAQKEMLQMNLLMQRASKFSFMLTYVVALPLIFNMDFVLQIWLGNVPKYTTEFCQLILICCVIDGTTSVFNTAINATGNIKGFQIGISFSFLLDIITSAILLVMNMHPALVFSSRIITRGFINMLIEFFFIRKQLAFNMKRYVQSVLLPILVTIAVTVPIMWFSAIQFEGWKALIISCAISLICCSLITWVLFLHSTEREKIYCIVKNKLSM